AGRVAAEHVLALHDVVGAVAPEAGTGLDEVARAGRRPADRARVAREMQADTARVAAVDRAGVLVVVTRGAERARGAAGARALLARLAARAAVAVVAPEPLPRDGVPEARAVLAGVVRGALVAVVARVALERARVADAR